MKNKVGRPRLEGVKLVPVPITLNPDKLDLFDALAIADGKTRSQRVRELIVEEIERRAKEK